MTVYLFAFALVPIASASVSSTGAASLVGRARIPSR